MSKESRLIGQITPKLTPIGNEMIIPNHSGDHVRSTKRALPVDEKDLVNKEYVDGLIHGNVELFLTEDASDIGTYFDLAVDNTGNPEEDLTQTITGSSTTLIAAFASILNEAEIEAITDLEQGIYSLHVHASANFPNGMTLYFEFYRRTSLGAETLLGTSHDSNTLSALETQEELHANITTDLVWDAGDRIIVKIYGRNSNAANKDITIYTEGDTLSRVEFPAFIPPTFVGAHNMASHTDDDTYNLNTSGTATIGGIIYADGNVGGLGLDVLRSANISINLEVGQDLHHLFPRHAGLDGPGSYRTERAIAAAKFRWANLHRDGADEPMALHFS